jgi:hypothetical protein
MSQELTASLFFTAVFGNTKAVTALSAIVAVSSFGNLLAGIVGSARVIRECGRCIEALKGYADTDMGLNLDKGCYLIPDSGLQQNLSIHLWARTF